MTNVEQLHRDPTPTLRTLRVVLDAGQDTYWCHMHPSNQGERMRPCASNALLDDLLVFQDWAADRIQRRADECDQAPLAHVVLASDQPVFNLGGDLALFAQLIRARDRATLMHYAYNSIDRLFRFHRLSEAPVHSIALVQGDAFGGGFEAALCCNTIIAEEGTSMGFLEVLFDMFPGMGAFTFLSRRIAPVEAERMMLNGRLYSAAELHEMGVVDVLAPAGQGHAVAREIIRRNRRIPNARRCMRTVREMSQPVLRSELLTIAEIWVDSALVLGVKQLATMDRLVRAQLRRFGPQSADIAAGAASG